MFDPYVHPVYTPVSATFGRLPPRLRARKPVRLSCLIYRYQRRLNTSPVSYSSPSRPRSRARRGAAEESRAAQRSASSFPDGRVGVHPGARGYAHHHDNTCLTRTVRSAIVSLHRGKNIPHYSRYARTHTESGCTAARVNVRRKNRAEYARDSLLF